MKIITIIIIFYLFKKKTNFCCKFYVIDIYNLISD